MDDTMYKQATEWLESMKEEYDPSDFAQYIIEYIEEVLWRDNDMRNS